MYLVIENPRSASDQSYSKGIFIIFDLTIHKIFAAFGGEYTSEPLIIFYVAHVEFYVAHVEFFKTVHVEFYVTYVENNKYDRNIVLG